jgi:hypothetical protein
MKPPKGPPFFFSIWPWDLLKISWEYSGIWWDIYRYTSIIYVCDTVDGWQILHQLRHAVKENCMGFNMFQPSKGGAGFRKNPQLSTVHFSKQWLSGFSTQQWLLYSYSALTCSVFLGLLPLYPQCKRLTMENHHDFYGKIHYFDWAIWRFNSKL